MALRDLVFFPGMVLPLLIGRPRSVAALEAAERDDGWVLVVAQTDAEIEEPGEAELHRTGTVVRATEVTRLPDGTARVVLEGVARASVKRFLQNAPHFLADVTIFGEDTEGAEFREPLVEALARQVTRMYEEYVRLNEQTPDDLLESLGHAGDRVRLAHLMAGHLLVPAAEKQKILEADSGRERFEALRDLLDRELEVLQIEEKIDRQMRFQLDGDRRKVYLQEQLRAIRKELGAEENEWDELEALASATALPEQARERVEREVRRLERLNPAAPEAAVIRTWIDWILALPWEGRSEDALDVAHASRVLDDAHHGLDEVKERILDHIAVLSLVGRMQGSILCLVGPPGVGKTSLGRSIARALGRDFVRVSLGGIRDEAEIRGHRRTYVGALPGRILQGMRRSGSRNPVFLLDEVDKLAGDFHGDPAAALLEVLDPEQNRTFTDHYLELDFDLSDVFFVATANTLAGIPGPLRDRMEIIRLPGYLDTEKREIARHFIWPRQRERHGLERSGVELTDAAIDRIIAAYTREAGVRELERQLSRVARKLARRRVDAPPVKVVEKAETSAPGSAKAPVGKPPAETVGPAELRTLLGPPPHEREERDGGAERVGIASGLAWTSAGGETMDVEVAIVPGKGRMQLTGTLGDVMKESAAAAVTYARSRARKLGLQTRFQEDVDIHIHIPEGATPKDGPSAGITIAAALVSALTGVSTRIDVAMTGEITLRGRVLAVGGIREKAVAALRSGMRCMVLPAGNEGELELLPEEVRERLRFVTVREMDEVLDTVLARDVPAMHTQPARKA
ncbi:MAG: endopeptidase La [Gemmatimonadota bacterium]